MVVMYSKSPDLHLAVMTSPKASRLTLANAMTTAIVTLAFLVVGPVADAGAAAERLPYAERVDLAGAAWITETDNSLTDLTIRVTHFAERSLWTGPINYKDPGIVLFYVHRERDPVTGAVTETNYEGFYGGPNASMSFRRSLAGATATFFIELWGYECQYPPNDGEPQGVLPEQAICTELDSIWVNGSITWTGYGAIWRDANNSKASEPPFAMWGAHSVVASRNAIATGTIASAEPNGIVLAQGTTDVGVLLRGKYHEQAVSPRP